MKKIFPTCSEHLKSILTCVEIYMPAYSVYLKLQWLDLLIIFTTKDIGLKYNNDMISDVSKS